MGELHEQDGDAGTPGAAIRRGDARGHVALRVDAGILWIEVAGEPEGMDIVECLREALETGRLAGSMPTLVDLTGFVGVIDWAAIRAVHTLAPWGASRVAYLSRSRLFASVIALVRVLFPLSHHRLFADRAPALAWLRAVRGEAESGAPA